MAGSVFLLTRNHSSQPCFGLRYSGCPTWLRLKHLHCHGFSDAQMRLKLIGTGFPSFDFFPHARPVFDHGHPFSQVLDGISFSHADVMTTQLLETLIARSSPRPRKQYPPGCFGNYIGPINFANHCWAVEGSARDQFDSELKPQILSHLDGWFGSVSSEDWVTLSIYMIGRTQKTASPTVLFISENDHYRKEARKVIKESGILKRYPGFKTAQTSTDPGWGGPLEQLALGQETKASSSVQEDSQATEVFYEHAKPLKPVGLPIYIRHGSSIRVATANAIRLRGHLFYLAPSHAFFDRLDKSEGPASEPEDVFEIDSDSEVEYEDVVEAFNTSVGSESPDTLSDYEDLSDDELHSTATLDTPEILSMMASPPHFRQLRDKILPYAKAQIRYMPQQTSMPPLESLTQLGVLFDWSVDQDWALVEVVENGDPDIASIISTNPYDLSRAQIAVLPQDGETVVTYTASGGKMTGSIIGMPSYTRLPRGTSFQEVFSIYLSGPLADGDCGSVVFSAATGELFGHIVAGCRSTGFAYVMAAHHVFPNLSKSALQIKDVEECHECSQAELNEDTALNRKGKYREMSLIQTTQSQHSIIENPVAFASGHETTVPETQVGVDIQENQQPAGHIEKDGNSLGSAQRLSLASQAYTKAPGFARLEHAPSLTFDYPCLDTMSTDYPSSTFDYPCLDTMSTDYPSLYDVNPVRRQLSRMPEQVATPLPCEFREFSGCRVQFRLRDIHLWMDHIMDDHLHGCFPRFSICWFCDGAVFQSNSNRVGDERECYLERMHHIHDHFADGMTAADIRPDFHFLDHLHDHGLIDEPTFERAKRQGELSHMHLLHSSGDNKVSDKVQEKSATPSLGNCHQSADQLNANQKNDSQVDINEPNST